ncbi:MAG: hypothetical protein K5985_08585 [Lachnospiraceae bacterium]|nr:hypothetical protein [Lachnospiraceae bacterium]
MSSSFDELLQDLVNKNDEEKLDIALDSYKDLLPVLREVDPKTEGIFMTMVIMGATAGADGKLTVGEDRFIRALMEARGVEMTDEKVLSILDMGTEEDAYDIIRELRSRLNNAGAGALVSFIAAICAMDDTISREEVALIKSLL